GKAGNPVPKITLTQHGLSDHSFLRMIIDSAKICAKVGRNVAGVISFSTSILVGAISLSTEEQLTQIIIEYIAAGLKSKNKTFGGLSFAVFAYLMTRVKLAQ